MKTASISEVKRHFDAYVGKSQTQPVMVTQKDKPIAVIVPVLDEDAAESMSLAYQTQFWQMLDDASRRIAHTGGVSHEDFWQTIEQEQG